MSDIRPFKAFRPTPQLAAQVAALPYDVMTSDEARVMVEGNPHSFLHVDKSEISLDKSVGLYDDAVYAKAAENLNNMISNGILVQDDKPCFYIYRQIMDGRAQTGLVACCSVNEYLDGSIKKHELTREDKERDRIRHVETCAAHTGPIFMAYRQKDAIDAVVDAWIAQNTPTYSFIAEDGISHIVWAINDEITIEQLRTLFIEVPALYIADGHHRNASAVKAAQNIRTQNPNYDPNAEFNFYLSVLFPSNQLYIMDYNRIIKGLNGLTNEAFLAKVAERFTIEIQNDDSTTQNGFKPKERHTFGMYLNGNWYLLTAKPEFVNENDSIDSLDVSVLQNNLLAPILNITDPRTNKNIDFVGGGRGVLELKRRVDSGEMAVAFSLYPTSMNELFGVADDDKIMPPKSTWFEPKLRSGLFIHKF